MKAGRKITLVIETPAGTVEEAGVVERVEGGKIYIEGLKEPFSENNGEKEGSFIGSRVYIKQVKGVMGTSREAIANPSLSPAVSREREPLKCLTALFK